MTPVELFRAAIDGLDRYQVAHLVDWTVDGDIAWSEAIKPPTDPGAFGSELIFVICNSGKNHKGARKIYDRVMTALYMGEPVLHAFANKRKAAAIEMIWKERSDLMRQFNDLSTDDFKLNWLQTLPEIGPVIRYHAAKNFGVDCAKPDVHLMRLAHHFKTDVDSLCREIARETGFRMATVDTVLWRACAVGVINSVTGELA